MFIQNTEYYIKYFHDKNEILLVFFSFFNFERDGMLTILNAYYIMLVLKSPCIECYVSHTQFTYLGLDLSQRWIIVLYIHVYSVYVTDAGTYCIDYSCGRLARTSFLFRP